jgi:hypothetical protein
MSNWEVYTGGVISVDHKNRILYANDGTTEILKYDGNAVLKSKEVNVETWQAKMTKEEFEEKIETEFVKFKEKFLANLDGKQINEEQNEVN